MTVLEQKSLTFVNEFLEQMDLINDPRYVSPKDASQIQRHDELVNYCRGLYSVLYSLGVKAGTLKHQLEPFHNPIAESLQRHNNGLQQTPKDGEEN